MSDSSKDSDQKNNQVDPEDEGQDLLPGWSSLVVMLLIFGTLVLITLLTILRGGDAGVAEHVEATVAFRPADFPEIDFDEPLLPEIHESKDGELMAGFTVPPPPFSEGIFPCSECHDDMDVNYDRRELEDFHWDISLNHGPKDRWCLDCHNAEERDYLHLVGGVLVGFDESYKLCGQCHGTIFRDWRAGIHGRRRGYWNGAKSYLLCAHCHNPHSPKFKPLKPLPPPVRPQFAAKKEIHEQ
jgi:hypothetical protein